MGRAGAKDSGKKQEIRANKNRQEKEAIPKSWASEGEEIAKRRPMSRCLTWTGKQGERRVRGTRDKRKKLKGKAESMRFQH